MTQLPPDTFERLPKGTPLTWLYEERDWDTFVGCDAAVLDGPAFWQCTGPADHAGLHVAEGMENSFCRWGGDLARWERDLT